MTDVAGMTVVEDLVDQVVVAEASTVSRTVLKADGVRLVLFAFDQGEELSEHTAAVPVLLQALDGVFTVSAEGRSVDLEPGSVIHLGSRVPHSVVTLAAGRLLLTMLDAR